MRLNLLLFLLWIALAQASGVLEDWFLGQNLIPSSLYERQAGRSLLVATVKTGYPPKERKLALVGKMQAGYPWALLGFDPEMVSSSVRKGISGMREQFVIGGMSIWIPYEVDFSAAPSYGCSFCDGVVFIGASSPLWSFANRVSFTAGSIVLDERGMRWNREVGPESKIKCSKQDGDSLCIANGLIDGVPLKVDFRFAESVTRLPEFLYYNYLLDKHPNLTPQDEWEPILIEFPSTGAKVKLNTQDILAVHPTRSRALTIAPWSSNDTILIGQEFLRSERFYRDLSNENAYVWPTYSNRGYSVQALLLMPLAVLLYMRISWGATFPVLGDAFQKTSLLYKVVQLTLDVLSVLVLVPALLNPNIWPIIAEFPWFLAMVIVQAAFLAFWAGAGLVGLYIGGAEEMGWYVSLDGAPNMPPTPFRPPQARYPHVPGNLHLYKDSQVASIVRQTIILRGSTRAILAFSAFLFAAEKRPDYFSSIMLLLLAGLWVFSIVDTMLTAICFTHSDTSAGWLAYLLTLVPTTLFTTFTMFVFSLVPMVQTVYRERGGIYTLILVNISLGILIGLTYWHRTNINVYVRMEKEKVVSRHYIANMFAQK